MVYQKALEKLQAQRRTFLTILFFIVLGIAFQMIAPWTFKLLIDNVLENEPVNLQSFTGFLVTTFTTKASLGLFAVFLFFVSNGASRILGYFQSLLVKRVSKQVMYQFSKDAFGNLELLSMGYFRNQTIGDYLYRLSYNISAIGELIEQGIIPFIYSVIYLLVVFLILFLINAQLALFAFIALPFLAIGSYILNTHGIHASKKSEYWNNAVFSFIQQSVTQLKIIQAFSREEKELADFNARVQTSLRAQERIGKLNLSLSLFVGLIIAATYSLVVWFGIEAVFEGTLSAGFLVAYLLYLSGATTPLLNSISSFMVIQESNVKIGRLDDYFDEKSHIRDTGTLTTVQNTSIEYKKVDCIIGEKKIISSVSFTIPQNSIVALVGVSGSGKTTLLSLLPRLIDEPTSGSISIGNHPIEEYTLKTLRNAIAYVPQEILLFNRSVRDIISFGKVHPRSEEIEKAAKLAVADEFIKKLPASYNFVIGEGGNYLSAGQRQRLMLARGYVKDAKILILDEVFSSQDVKTRLEMLENLRKSVRGKTVLLATNEEEIIAEADFVILVNEGKIVKTLTHKEIVQKNLLRGSNFKKLLGQKN